jgi:hypothetical protein
MKKISLTLLIIGLSCTLYAAASLTVKISTLEALTELNKYWSDNSIPCEVIEVPTTEKELIKLHLKLVVKFLKTKNNSHLTRQQLTNRVFLLNELQAYGVSGIFPINAQHYKRTPYFIDDFNTACAVGQLIKKSGNEKLAESISEEYNYFYLEDMPQQQIITWACEYGFTMDELKWIQPGYSPHCLPGQVIQPQCANSGFNSSGCFNPDWQSDSLIQPLLYLTEIFNGNAWVIDSMNVWQWQGAAPGQYKITVTDSLNRSVVYNYTITAPPAIASNDSVLHHTSSRTSCDGSLTVNPSNGGGFYRITLMNQSLLYSRSNTTGLFDSLCPAVYTILIYDTLNCQGIDSAQIQFSTGLTERVTNTILNFQNPITNNVLDLETSLSGIKIVQLIDMKGKIVLQFSSSQRRMSQELIVKSGLYILQISGENNVFQKKLMVAQ